MASTTPVTRQRADKVMPLFIGYVLMLAQFILLALFIAGPVFGWFSGGELAAMIAAWAVLLVLSLWAMAHQATVNRYNEAQGSHPSPHLLVPTETPARISAYHELYRPSAAAAAVTAENDSPLQAERAAA
ncbi:hypothetical protein MUG78_07815 [Gordonia alkaliphila]|uniref:Uncharacterized protein n=1 Tax=Gordonia alkaliphila TaxID=1053547 RepID=A0ABP8ZFL7_9ACTN|nr:hypothetical protein [Gordonia alkaliphila]MCK0439366.1 hypothetical protein [Gordonia alkaliphila]